MLNKYSYLRYRVIDKCLNNKHRKWTWRDLAEVCSDEIREYYDSDKSNLSERTIKKDIADMNSLYADNCQLPEKGGKMLKLIEYDRANSTYYYTVENFSIYQVNLTDKEKNAILDAVDLLKQFNDFSFISPFSEALGKISLAIKDQFYDDENILIFEKVLQTPDVKRKIEDLSKIIHKKKEINFTFYPFLSYITSKIKFHPYYITEFNNRWYVIGWNETKQEKLSIPIDRVIQYESTDKIYERNKHFNYLDYYDEVIGVTFPISNAEKIIISSTPSHAIFMEARKLHPTQKILRKTDTEVIFEIKVRINKELISELCSYANHIKILEPEDLVEEIKEIYKESLKKYK